MIPILIDTSEISLEFSMTQKEVDDMKEYVLNNIVTKFARAWDTQAKLELSSTREQYRNSLIVGEIGRFQKYVMLVGKLPNMIENGASAFDMKIGFAKSSKITVKKDGGWFLTIPFRFATPGSLGENSVFTQVMPEEIYSIVKKQSSSISQMNQKSGSSKGLSLSQIPTQYQTPSVRNAYSSMQAKKTFEEYKHRTSIYEGMVRSKQTYERAIQSQYNTFRRVSDKSDPNSWIHSGIVAHNLSQKALTSMNIPFEVGRSVDSFLSSL